MVGLCFFGSSKTLKAPKEGLMNLTYPNPSTTMKICLQLEESWTKFKLAAQAVQDSTKCIAGIKELGLFLRCFLKIIFPIGNPAFQGIYREYWRNLYRESIFSHKFWRTCVFFFVGPLDIGPQQKCQKIQERVHAFLGETLSHRARGQPKTMLDAKESREFLFYTSLNPERLTAMNKESGLQNLCFFF